MVIDTNTAGHHKGLNNDYYNDHNPTQLTKVETTTQHGLQTAHKAVHKQHALMSGHTNTFRPNKSATPEPSKRRSSCRVANQGIPTSHPLHPVTDQNPKKIDLLGFEIWHYRTKFSKNFQQFSNHFSIFIIHAKVDPHSGLLKRTKMHSFFEIFQAPQK